MHIAAWRAAASMAMTLFASDAAWGQLIKPGIFPPPKDSLILFEMLRPVERPGLLHGWLGTLSQQYGDLESKPGQQLEARQLDVTAAGLNVRVGARGFGGIDFSYSDQEFDLQIGPAAVDGGASGVGLRATGGYMVLPFLAVGVSVARATADAVYHVPPGGASSRLDGTATSYSAFATLLYPVDDWKLSLTGIYGYGEAQQSFVNNMRPEQTAWARSGSLLLAALHPIAARLDGRASLGWNHIIDHRGFETGRAVDEDWLMPSLGLIYRLTERASVTLTGSLFVMNEVYDYDSVSLGLNYKF